MIRYYKGDFMKYVVSTILILMLLTAAGANASEDFILYSNDMNIFSPNETEFQMVFTQSSFKPFETNANTPNFLEYFGIIEYGLENGPCSLQLGWWQDKPSVVTRVQLFDKPIYLTFTISE